jgi:hypothetical protein
VNEETWRRHSNPWSVWTRYAALPLLVASIWSRKWLASWALVPISLSVVWLWLNPRIFKHPLSTNNWASKAVLGERVWLNRKKIPIPPRHQLSIPLLAVNSIIGLLLLSWGLIKYSVCSVIFGMVCILGVKSWFNDRMVLLYEEMKDASPEYRSWLY